MRPMSKKKFPELYNGLICLDKPKGITSHDAIVKVRRILGQKSVGHCGTLDPLASGLLLLILGQGTKLSPYLLNGDKGYRVTAQFGITTDTLDVTGKILEESSSVLSVENIKKAFLELPENLELPVPMFSAVKVGGKKLYKEAHKGRTVETPIKSMHFYDKEILDVSPDKLSFQVKCSKGGYIRSLVHELGKILGSGAVVAELRRTWSAPYEIHQAMDIDSLESAVASDELPLMQGFSSMADMLPSWHQITVTGRDESLLLSGQIPHDLFRLLIPEQRKINQNGQIQNIKVVSGSRGGALVSILQAKPNAPVSICRVFPAI